MCTCVQSLLEEVTRDDVESVELSSGSKIVLQIYLWVDTMLKSKLATIAASHPPPSEASAGRPSYLR